MAVDTARKRASLIGYGLPFRLMLPIADGSLDQGDRQHLVGLYAGILAGAAVVAVPSFPNDSSFTKEGPGDSSFLRLGVAASGITRSGLGSSSIRKRTSS